MTASRWAASPRTFSTPPSGKPARGRARRAAARRRGAGGWREPTPTAGIDKPLLEGAAFQTGLLRADVPRRRLFPRAAASPLADPPFLDVDPAALRHRRGRALPRAAAGLAVRLFDLSREADVDVFLGEWLNLLLRWAHMVVGIGWIGTSFYFMALDYTLIQARADEPGRARHRLAGARRRLLSRREIHGRAGDAAGRAALVQVGGLSHLGHRLRPADRAVLLPRRGLSDRSRR